MVTRLRVLLLRPYRDGTLSKGLHMGSLRPAPRSMIYRSFFPPTLRHCRSRNFSFSFPWPGSKLLRPLNARCSIARQINSIGTASETMARVQRARISFRQILFSIVLNILNASGLGLGMHFTIEWANPLLLGTGHQLRASAAVPVARRRTTR